MGKRAAPPELGRAPGGAWRRELYHPRAAGAALRVMHWLAAQQPELEQWACFDTAFHATLPPEAATYAIPADWRRQGLRRVAAACLLALSELSGSMQDLRAAAAAGHEGAQLAIAVFRHRLLRRIGSIDRDRNRELTAGHPLRAITTSVAAPVSMAATRRERWVRAIASPIASPSPLV